MLMKTGHPEYYIPLALTVSRDVRLVFKCTRKWVAKILEDYKGDISFATDAWTLLNHYVYVALTAHLEAQGQPISIVLNIVEVLKYACHSSVQNRGPNLNQPGPDRRSSPRFTRVSGLDRFSGSRFKEFLFSLNQVQPRPDWSEPGPNTRIAHPRHEAKLPSPHLLPTFNDPFFLLLPLCFASFLLSLLPPPFYCLPSTNDFPFRYLTQVPDARLNTLHQPIFTPSFT